MSYPYTVTFVTPASSLSIANKIARAFDADNGRQFTFKVGCSSDGNEPITHYIANTWAEQKFVDQISGVRDGTLPLKELVDAVYAARWSDEVAPTQEECGEFWSSTVIDVDRDWREVLSENNLKLLQDEMPA